MSPRPPIDQLLSIASPPFRESTPPPPPLLTEQGGLGDELHDLWCRRNGFFAFESALHLLPLGSGEGMDLETWNSPGLWRQEFGDMADGFLFFAEDLFGVQFGLRGDRVHSFDPETGEAEVLADDLSGWSATILADYRVLTGYPLGHAWQERHGALPRGRRLAPKTPFVLGGAFEIENLYSAEPAEVMRFRGSIARQIHDLPDGARIRLQVIE